MTASPVRIIVELHGPDAGLSRSLPWNASVIATGSRIASDPRCYTPVTCLAASSIRDSQRGHHRKSSIQTP